jgi:hypothetical protein
VSVCAGRRAGGLGLLGAAPGRAGRGFLLVASRPCCCFVPRAAGKSPTHRGLGAPAGSSGVRFVWAAATVFSLVIETVTDSQLLRQRVLVPRMLGEIRDCLNGAELVLLWLLCAVLLLNNRSMLWG